MQTYANVVNAAGKRKLAALTLTETQPIAAAILAVENLAAIATDEQIAALTILNAGGKRRNEATKNAALVVDAFVASCKDEAAKVAETAKASALQAFIASDTDDAKNYKKLTNFVNELVANCNELAKADTNAAVRALAAKIDENMKAIAACEDDGVWGLDYRAFIYANEAIYIGAGKLDENNVICNSGNYIVQSAIGKLLHAAIERVGGQKGMLAAQAPAGWDTIYFNGYIAGFLPVVEVVSIEEVAATDAVVDTAYIHNEPAPVQSPILDPNATCPFFMQVSTYLEKGFEKLLASSRARAYAHNIEGIYMAIIARASSYGIAFDYMRASVDEHKEVIYRILKAECARPKELFVALFAAKDAFRYADTEAFKTTASKKQAYTLLIDLVEEEKNAFIEVAESRYYTALASKIYDRLADTPIPKLSPFETNLVLSGKTVETLGQIQQAMLSGQNLKPYAEYLQDSPLFAGVHIDSDFELANISSADWLSPNNAQRAYNLCVDLCLSLGIAPAYHNPCLPYKDGKAVLSGLGEQLYSDVIEQLIKPAIIRALGKEFERLDQQQQDEVTVLADRVYCFLYASAYPTNRPDKSLGRYPLINSKGLHNTYLDLIRRAQEVMSLSAAPDAKNVPLV